MVFSRCTRCGLAAGVACVCAFAVAHHQSLCGQFNPGEVYCTKAAVELPHGPHHNSRISWVRTNASITTASSTATLTSSLSFPITRR
jgi:hypothetical protein